MLIIFYIFTQHFCCAGEHRLAKIAKFFSPPPMIKLFIDFTCCNFLSSFFLHILHDTCSALENTGWQRLQNSEAAFSSSPPWLNCSFIPHTFIYQSNIGPWSKHSYRTFSLVWLKPMLYFYLVWLKCLLDPQTKQYFFETIG